MKTSTAVLKKFGRSKFTTNIIMYASQVYMAIIVVGWWSHWYHCRVFIMAVILL